jgi:hypothetical protein
MGAPVRQNATGPVNSTSGPSRVISRALVRARLPSSQLPTMSETKSDAPAGETP